MSELSGAMGSAGPKHQITTPDGKKYPVMLIDQRVKMTYEKILFGKLRDALGKVKGIADKDYYERKMDSLVDRYQLGDFSMESEFGRAALTKPGGSMLLLAILMGTVNPLDETEIVPMDEMVLFNLIAKAPEEVAAVFKAVMLDSFPGVDVAKIAEDIEKAGAGVPKVETVTVQSPSG